MIGKMIFNRLDAIVNPVHNELRVAQEQTFERIQQVLSDSEAEVAHEIRFMSPEQRLKTAEKELEKVEEQLLSALSSMFKVFWYVAPQINPFNLSPSIKEVEGEVIDQVQDMPSKT